MGLVALLRLGVAGLGLSVVYGWRWRRTVRGGGPCRALVLLPSASASTGGPAVETVAGSAVASGGATVSVGDVPLPPSASQTDEQANDREEGSKPTSKRRKVRDTFPFQRLSWREDPALHLSLASKRPCAASQPCLEKDGVARWGGAITHRGTSAERRGAKGGAIKAVRAQEAANRCETTHLW